MKDEHDKAVERVVRRDFPHLAPPDTTKVPQRRDPKPAPAPKQMPPDTSKGAKPAPGPVQKPPVSKPPKAAPEPQRKDAPKTDERGMYRRK